MTPETHITILYVVIVVMAVPLGLLIGRAIMNRIFAVDKKIDDIQEAFIDAHAVFVDLGLHHLEKIAKYGGSISQRKLVKEIRQAVEIYRSPERALLELDDCFKNLLAKRANNPKWVKDTAELILNENKLLAALDEAKSKAEIEKKVEAAAAKARQSLAITSDPTA